MANEITVLKDYELDNPNYAIDYNDSRLTDVKSDEQAALTGNKETYKGMIDSADSFYQAQIDEINRSKDEQIKLQNERTDFTLQQIEQQKEQTRKDYTKEQSGAYVDWQKQSNQYGVNAEYMAGSGLTNTGYSERSKVAMYNTYQNRVAVAREALSRAIMNYDNQMTEARLQNNSVIAQITADANEQAVTLALEGFQYKNTLIAEMSNKELELKQHYSNEYQKVLDQMNKDNAMAEEVRQYNKNQELAYAEYLLAAERAQEEITLAQEEAKNDKDYKDALLELQKQELQHQKDKLTEEQRQYDLSLAEEQRQFDATKGTAPLDTGKGVVSYDETNLASLGITSADQYFYMLDNGLIEEYREGDKIYARRTTSTTNRNNQTSSTDLGNAALQAMKQKIKAELETYRWD